MFARLTDSPGRSEFPSANSIARLAFALPWVSEISSSSHSRSCRVTSVRGTDTSGCAVRRSAASASATPAAKVVHAAMSATVRASVVTRSRSIEIDSRGNPTVCRSSMLVDRPPVARGTRTCALVGHEPTSGSRHNAAAEWCEKTVSSGAASDTALTRARYLWSPLRAFQSDARM